MDNTSDTRETDRRSWLLRDSVMAWLLVLPVLAILLRLAPIWSTNPDLGHGWLVGCFLVGWLWDRWDKRPQADPPRLKTPAWAWIAIPVVTLLALIPARLLLTPYPYWPGLLWLWSGAFGLLVFAGLFQWGGRAWLRHFSFGALLLASALPWPHLLQVSFVEPSRELIADLATEILNFAGFPTVAHGTTLLTMGRWVGMDEACSGLRSLHLALAFGLIVGELGRMRLRHRIWTFGLAACTAILANLARVLFLAWRAAEGAPTEDPLHDLSGYIAYALLLAPLGIAWLCWRRKLDTTPASRQPARPAPDRNTQRWCLTVALGCVAIESGVTVWFAANDAGWHPSWQVRLPTGAPYFTRIELNSESKAMLRADHYEGASWTNRDKLTRVVFYTEWKQGQAANFVAFAHNPTVCFPSSGCRLEGPLGTIAVQRGAQTILFHGHHFTRADQEIVAYFTVWDADLQQELVQSKPLNDLSSWWSARWAYVTQRRSQTRAQMLTVAFIGNRGVLNLANEAFIQSEIERVMMTGR